MRMEDVRLRLEVRSAGREELSCEHRSFASMADAMTFMVRRCLSQSFDYLDNLYELSITTVMLTFCRGHVETHSRRQKPGFW